MKASARAIEMIAREADGSVRDGLSLLDQIFSFCGETVDEKDIVQVLGLVDRKIFTHLSVALLGGDLEKSLALLEESYSAGLDLKRFAGDLLQYFRAIMICQNCSNPAGLLDVSDQELKELSELARNQSKETVYRYFQILMQGVEEMRYSSKPRLTMEMSFIKATQAGQVMPASTLLSRLDALVQGGMAGIPETSQPQAIIADKPPGFVPPASVVVKEKPVKDVPVSQSKEAPLPKRDDRPVVEPLEKPKQQQASPFVWRMIKLTI